MSYTKRRFTEEQIEKANNANIMDYVISQGLDFKKVGSNSYHIKGYGGLYVNPSENKWNCFSQCKGGGPIQFIMFMENKTWVEAVKQLLDISPRSVHRSIFKNNQVEENKEKFILPQKNNTYKHIFAYLIQTRQIDKEIVYKLIKEDKLYEDKNRNCVFIGYDKGNNPKYANRRGTNTDIAFKGEVKKSDKSHSFYFGNNGDTVYVFESPIDAMSHATLFKIQGLDWKNQYRLSLGGLAEIGLDRFLRENPEIRNITLCLDNDQAGYEAKQKLSKKYIEKGYSVNIFNMVEKDVNDELKFVLKNHIYLEDNKWLETDYETELEL